MFDKLKFWKGHEDSSLGDPDMDLGAGHLSDDPMRRSDDPLQGSWQDPLQRQGSFDSPQGPLDGSFDGQPPHGPTNYPQGGNPFMQRSSMLPQQSQEPEHYEVAHEVARGRDTELILAKLDAIKSELDSMHQRVKKLEESTDSKSKQRYW